MLPVSRVIGHKEYGNTPPGGWSGRKQDPVYAMDWRRQRVANFRPRNAAPAPVRPTPPRPPAPPAIPPVPGLPGWSLPRGHYYGHKNGPAASHGGYHASERAAVKAIQRRLIAKGCVPGVTDWRNGWADGIWEDATSAAVRRWFARFRPGQQFTDRIYADDYAVLGR